MKKKMLSLLLVISMVCAMAAGCGSSGSDESSSSSDSSNSKETASVVYNATESESWDPLRDSTSGGLIKHMFEGLMTYEGGELTEGVADTIEVSEDGLTYTITLKEDAVWSDGEPVTAGDFKYSWLRQLNPENAGKYAKDLYWLENGEEYNAGTASADDVGIEVQDDYTLVLTLKAPCAYFDELLASKVYLPVREDVVEADENWWSDPETCIGNGPFKLKSYTPNESIVMEKNENYREADLVNIQELTARFITDSEVELMAYQTDEIQAGIMPPTESLDELEESGDLYSSAKLTCYWLVLNCNTDALSDANVRKALAMAIDRDSLVENVTKGGEIPAYDLIPPEVEDSSTGEAFNTESESYFSYDVEAAQELLAEAGYPDGEGFPELTYAISSGSNHAEIAQAIQSMWEENLGITVNIVEEETSVFISDRKAGTFDIARYTWEGSFSDPDTWLALYLSDSENNDSFYSSAEYDEFINQAQLEVDEASRFELLHEADELLIAEDMAVIPLFYPALNYIIKPSVKDLGINANGDMYWKTAYIEE